MLIRDLIGQGLSSGVCNQECPFTIATGAEKSITFDGATDEHFTCLDNKDGTCSVSYRPTAPGDYKIMVKFENENIPGRVVK